MRLLFGRTVEGYGCLLSERAQDVACAAGAVIFADEIPKPP